MSDQGKLEAEAIASALEFKEALQALMEKYGVHAALFCWVTPTIGEHIEAGSSLAFGCPECGGRIVALAVQKLDMAWRGSFVQQIQSLNTMKVIHHHKGPGTTH